MLFRGPVTLACLHSLSTQVMCNDAYCIDRIEHTVYGTWDDSKLILHTSLSIRQRGQRLQAKYNSPWCVIFHYLFVRTYWSERCPEESNDWTYAKIVLLYPFIALSTSGAILLSYRSGVLDGCCSSASARQPISEGP